MSVFSRGTARSRMRTVIGGIAVAGASALVLAGCAGGGTAEPSDLVRARRRPDPQDRHRAAADRQPRLPRPARRGRRRRTPPAQVNEVSGETGLTLDIVYGDSGDTDNKAYETEIPRLLGEGVSAIIGAASSGTSLQFIDQVVGAGVIQFSPANTSDAFTTYEDNGLYFRTAPSDVLQGEVLGNLIAEDGAQTLGMIVLNDSYGTGLAKYVTEAFEAAGGEVVAAPTYNTGDTSFDAQISEVLAADPDAIALITFEEIATILPGPVRFLPERQALLRRRQPVELRRRASPPVPSRAPRARCRVCRSTPSVTSRARWTSSSRPKVSPHSRSTATRPSPTTRSFCSRWHRSLPDRPTPRRSPRSCRKSLAAPATARRANTYADCAAIIVGGGVADYDGISGPITFDEVGDPTEASIGIYQYGEDNNYVAYEG